MGKLSLRYDPKHDGYSHKQSKNLKVMNKSLKKSVKVTYISSPLLVRTCDASEFRSVVQQLTGKDSNEFIDESPTTRVMQVGDLRATVAAGDENYDSSYYNRLMNSLEFDEDHFWNEVATYSVLQSPCVLV